MAADHISSLEKRLAEVSEDEVLKYASGPGLKAAQETFGAISRDTTGTSKAGRLMRGGLKPYLLGGSTKLDHNDTSGIASVLGSHQWIQYMQPANASQIPGCNTCGSNTKGCTAACLGKSGQLGLASGEIAKEARTAMAWHEPAKYLGLLHNQIGQRERVAAREGRAPIIRLNGTSDIGWHRLPSAPIILGSRPGTLFSEYTKFNTGDVVDHEDSNDYDNYSWIHSITENTTVGRIKQIVNTQTERGHRNVAVPFDMKKGDPVPNVVTLGDNSGASIDLPVVKVKGVSVGDAHDMRVRDPQEGGVVALRAKEIVQDGKRGIFDKRGFIRPVETPVSISTRPSRSAAFRG
jgi:hypothetical protein